MRYYPSISPAKFFVHVMRYGLKICDLPPDEQYPDRDNEQWFYKNYMYHFQYENVIGFHLVHFVKKL